MEVLTIIFAIVGIIGIGIRFYYAIQAKKHRRCYGYHEELEEAIVLQKNAIRAAAITFMILLVYWVLTNVIVTATSNVLIVVITAIDVILLAIDIFQVKEDEDKYFRF